MVMRSKIAAIRLTVEPAEAPLRLDVFLAGRLGVSRRQVRQLLGEGAVTIVGGGGGKLAKGTWLESGAVYEVAPFEREEQLRVRGQRELPLVVLAAGDGFVVVDKPAGMAVRPHSGLEGGTVLNAVVARWPSVQGIGEAGLRSGVVHRLDVNTSGALVVATEQKAWLRLRQAFIDHRVRKTYRALVHGQLDGCTAASMPLAVVRHRPARVAVVHDGVPCRLSWRCQENFARTTLLEVQLHTGFLHQVRVMLAHRGHPLVGDLSYGPATLPRWGATRHMLHAASINIDDLHAHSPDPADFVQIIAQQKQDADVPGPKGDH